MLHFLSAALSLDQCSQRTLDDQGLDGLVHTGLQERGQILSRQEVKVKIKCLYHFSHQVVRIEWEREARISVGFV